MEQTPSHAEALAKRLEETWDRTQPSAVQIQRKSLLWEEKIEGFSIITSEGLTTLAHPQLGWTITSGMWNTLRTTWGPTMATLMRIHESYKTQSLLESADVLTPTTHILQAIRTYMDSR